MPWGPVPDSITVTPDPASVSEDGTLQMTATAHWPTGPDTDETTTVGWQSSDESVATVTFLGHTHLGLVHGVAPGSCTISATFAAAETDPVPPPPAPSVTDSVTLTVTAAPPLVDPVGRVNVAFGWNTLEANPDWTRLDDHPNLVTSYSIQRGRGSELDRGDSGRATIEIIDPDGVLDTNDPGSPIATMIRPLVQACIGRQDPVTGDWKTRFRGFVEDFSYEIDPALRFNRLSITLVDLFELLNASEMQPLEYGTTAPAGTDSDAQVFFDQENVDARITGILRSYGLPKRLQAILPAANIVFPAVYSAGEAAMSAIREAADAEGPAPLTNVYCDRRGRISFQPKLTRFDPAGTAAAAGPDLWDFHQWKTGDGAAITASPSDTVQIRELSFNRGLASIINHASATPVDIPDQYVTGQLVVDTDSVGFYGPRSWSASSLLTHGSIAGSPPTLSLEETKRFATFIVLNYRDIRDRPTAGFRSLMPEDPRAPALWEFLNTVDIGDLVQVTVTGRNGDPVFSSGGSDMFFVEQIQEDVKPLTPTVDDVTLRVGLTAQEYYMHNPWA